ncbi:MAG: AMP-binding protein [Chthoniobacter sp.]
MSTRQRIRLTAPITPTRSSVTHAFARPAARPRARWSSSTRRKAGTGCWATGQPSTARAAWSLATAFTSPFPSAHSSVFWTAFDAAAKGGYLGIPGGGLGSAARVRAMIQHRATVLCCTPTYALHLAEAAVKEEIDLREASVKKIIVAGETGGSVPEVRQRISAAWHGAEVLDHYGMTEVGPAAYQTPQRPDLLHIIEDSYFAEIVRPETGEPVAPGETGELVLTTLGRTACPLLRYRTGDLVRRVAEVPGFALAGGIIGRADDMVVVRGVNLYPAAFDAAVRLVPEIEEYRVVISRRGALTEVEVQFESADDTAAKKLERALSSTFSLRIPVTHVAALTLPRFEMKARRWIWRDSK